MYGEMGSTLPLLLIEDRIFWRTGFVADIFANGCRPLTRIRTKAATAAKTSSNNVRFRHFLSMVFSRPFPVSQTSTQTVHAGGTRAPGCLFQWWSLLAGSCGGRLLT